MKRRASASGFWWLLVCLVGMTVLLFSPVIFHQRTVVNGNHLVAFYQPWASSPELGWGITVQQKPVGDDDLWIFYPQRSFTMTALRQYHEIPFWNPLSFAGNHEVGLSETAVFYPFNLLFFLTSQITVWNVLILLEPLLVGIGMYLYLRLVTKRMIQAIYGAVVLAFSEVVLVRAVEGISVGHTLLWLPFALWIVEAYVQKRALRYPVFLTLVLVASFTAGWFQYTFYIAVVGLTYLTYRMKNDLRAAVPILIPFVAFPVLSLFQLIPVVRAFLESPRGIDQNHYVQLLHLAPLQHLVTLLFPDFWGNPGTFNFFGPIPYKEAIMTVGIVPLVLAIVGIRQWKDTVAKFFIALTAVTLIIGLKSPLSQFFVSLPIPIVGTFIPSRIFTLTSFCLAILSAYGFGALFEEKERNEVIRVAAWVLGIATALAVGLWGAYLWTKRLGLLPNTLRLVLLVGKPEHVQIQARNAVLPVGLAAVFLLGLYVFRTKRTVTFVLLLTFILTIGQLWYDGHKYLAFSDPAYAYPPHPLFTELQKRIGDYRFVTLGTAHIATNIPLAYGLPSLEGAGSMYIERYGQLISYVTDPHHEINHVLRIETYLNSATNKLLTGGDPTLLRFFELSGAKYFTSLDNDRDSLVTDASASAQFHKVWQQNHWQIWENINTLPRTFVTGDFSIKTTSEAILSDMFNSGQSLRHVVLEKNPGIVADKHATGNAVITRYTPNTMTVRVTADRPALLYVSDTFSNTFNASVDGEQTQLLRANFAFRAVAVPAGTHIVTMEYDTKPWQYSTIISLGLWVFGGMSIVYLVRARQLKW